MIDRLRSHSKKQQGFTLIELLVVIAIIAILVVIVVVAINPAERLREAADRRAAANVRSAGTLISTCITRNNGAIASCATSTAVEATTGGDGKLPATSTFCTDGSTVSGMFEQGRTSSTSTYWVYRSTTGQVSTSATAPSTTTCS